MTKSLDIKGKTRRWQTLPGYSSFTFQDLNDDKKKDVINRLKLLSDEFNDRSEIELFSSGFLSHVAKLSPLLNILIDVNIEALEKIAEIVFQKIKDTDGKDTDINNAATYFVGLLERIGFIRDDFKDQNDKMHFDNLSSLSRATLNVSTLNWELTRLSAEYKFGINLGEDYDAYPNLCAFEFFASGFTYPMVDEKDADLMDQVERLKEELDDFEELCLARYGLDKNTDYKTISRLCISKIGDLKESYIENASINKELEWVPHEYENAKGETITRKNFEFKAESAHEWLMNTKKAKYFPTLFDERNSPNGSMILAFNINNKEELDKFIKDNEESKKRITDYPLDTIFAINPNKNINKFKGIQKQRLEWLGLDGKSLSTIVNTENPYREHERIRSPYTHIGYDLNQERVVIKEEES